ncbi:hypothetical protein B9T25_09465 [Acinetobacter sp. ANC 4470]|uniref:hypothetical protein n=1 Tax=Acinetobacter sp. ANC 4470 TaxID=1977881 RepID=UPI000A34FD2A|nr:hypothetical protein [Acinetobacter sp. ANC 4470]OTG66982.1 hypothetical protein B9T25_09465 [Acinetobacter sp. ANC 4470]
MTKLAYSSDIYHIKIEELLALSDAYFKSPFENLYSDDVVLFIGQEKKKLPDTLACGRDVLVQALNNGLTHYPTRILFEQRAPQLQFFALLKPLRKKYQDFSMLSYEIQLSDIIENKLERNIKSEETAYNYSDRNKWGVPKDQRQARFHEIDESFKKDGYDKRYPMAIMLCRGLGVKDKLHQGHHRMFFCRKYNIQYVQIQFLACNSFTGQLKQFFLWLNKTIKYKQVN